MLEQLQQHSLIILGERWPSKISWVQLYTTNSKSDTEDYVRSLLSEVGQTILQESIQPGSARKLKDGWKLLYYEVPGRGKQRNKIYGLVTKAMKLYTREKKAMEAVSFRGGVYSARRFFSEFLDLVQNEEDLKEHDNFSLQNALEELENYDASRMDVNYIGRLISYIERSIEIDNDTLEKVYFVVYEMLTYLESLPDIDIDIDLGLDAAFTVAELYQERDVFHLALELYKRIIPLSIIKSRYGLEVACRVKIAAIYYRHFPDSSEGIREVLIPVTEIQITEASLADQEAYYCLLGNAYESQENIVKAKKFYYKAIKRAEININSPEWIAIAYKYLAKEAKRDLYPNLSSSYYLTAASLAFSAGDVAQADAYRSLAAEQELNLATADAYYSLGKRMESDLDAAVFKIWNAIRTILRAYEHIDILNRYKILPATKEVLNIAAVILKIPGQIRKNTAILNKVSVLIEDLQLQKLKEDQEQKKLKQIIRQIDNNIPLPAPNLLIFEKNGLMLTSGTIGKESWESSNLEGTLLSGVLSAIMAVLSEVSDSSLRTVDAGNFKIIVERTKTTVGVLLIDREGRMYRPALKRLLKTIDSKFGVQLANWTGDLSFLSSMEQLAYNHFKSIFY